jgi:hypothetical protein
LARTGIGDHHRRPGRGQRGTLDLAVEYAKIREQYGHTIGSYQAVAHLLAEALTLTEGSVSILRHAAWAVDELPPAEAVRAAQVAVYCARAARTVCETSIQVHGGIGNTWECLAHVYLRRALTSTELWPAELEEIDLDFRDSADEAAFRERLRDWLALHAKEFPTSGDEYWAKAGDWHRALYEAVLRAVLAQGVRRTGTRAGLRRHPRRGAAPWRAPPRPSLGYRRRPGTSRQQGTPAAVPAGHDQRDRTLVPGLPEPGAGSDLASLTTTAVRDGDNWLINGHKIWTSYSDIADWCLVLARTDPEAKRHKYLGVHLLHAPAGDRAAAAEDDQRYHQRVRSGQLRQRCRARREHGRRSR